LAANALSPRGLRLGRDYFPSGFSSGIPVELSASSPANPPSARPAVSQGSAGAQSPTSSAPLPEREAGAQRLHGLGLQTVGSNEVSQLFADPGRVQGLIVFVDARDDDHFMAGHLPGAWQFDRFRPEIHLPQVLPVCLAASKVVVYCAGGECEDSAFAAIQLRDAGVSQDALRVYLGGFTEWKALGLPIERGARGSGAAPNGQP
jgi:rhodanese-related sulfurtransferase